MASYKGVATDEINAASVSTGQLKVGGQGSCCQGVVLFNPGAIQVEQDSSEGLDVTIDCLKVGDAISITPPQPYDEDCFLVSANVFQPGTLKLIFRNLSDVPVVLPAGNYACMFMRK
ncbi:hypothetical protein D3C81_1089000 [compost metagenome]